MSKAKCIMVQGTMSGAGKSMVCAALCRIFAQDGYRTAPFKSQNMALNSYITYENLEIGRAQAMQAQAAGIEPDVRMNPILLKPSSDVKSQVIVNGKVRQQMNAKDYFKYKKALMPEILDAYNSLADEYDIIVIEGAGSPAEINLKTDDIVNMGLAKMVNAPVLLVGDIDRGGVFAQLFGTVELLEKDEKQRISGLIINKFRGDPSILSSGLDMLEQKTGIPVIGTVPYVYADIDDEDSLSERLEIKNTDKFIDIAVIRLPRISNFTDFSPLESHPALGIRYVKNVKELKNPDMIIIPGTKSTADDLLWMRQNGLESEIIKAAAKGTLICGVCGGYQMLGISISDADNSESKYSKIHGMGLLPEYTEFCMEKVRTRVTAEVIGGVFEGVKLNGYEIHMGRTYGDGQPFCRLSNGNYDGCIKGNVFGTYLHGLFDTGELTNSIAEYLCRKKGIDINSYEKIDRELYVQKQYNIIADAVRKNVDINRIYNIMEGYIC